MNYLTDTLDDFRGIVYSDFRRMVEDHGSEGVLTFEKGLPSFVFAPEGKESCHFVCDKIEVSKDEDKVIRFFCGDYVATAAEFLTDDLVFMHDEVLNVIECQAQKQKYSCSTIKKAR